MFSDGRFQWAERFKAEVLSGLRPVFEAVDLPSLINQWTQKQFQSKDELQIELARLESENIVLRGKLQKLSALAIENVRLRELLNADDQLEENVLVAEVISVSPDPASQHVIINKGSKHGIYIGQAVVDAYGLFGQVVNIGQSVAKVLLISDQRQSVPVQLNRNGTRFIAEGVNDFLSLSLSNVALTADIKAGDILSTSGLGQLYPAGYPVGKVSEVSFVEGDFFATISIEPFARLNQSRQVLLLFADNQELIVKPIGEQQQNLKDMQQQSQQTSEQDLAELDSESSESIETVESTKLAPTLNDQAD